MKKSLCLILSAAVIALTLCSCSIIKDKDVLKDYQYTDANGNTYQYATDADGNIVTKEDGGKETTTKSASASGAGDMTVLVTDENGEYVTNKDGSAVTSKLDSSALMEADEKMMGETTTKKGSSSGNSSTKKNDTTTKVSGGTGSSSKDLLDDGTKTNKTNLKEKVIDPVIKSGTFTVECNLIADSVSMPTTLAFRGNDFSFTVKMSGLDFRVFSNNGKYYLALPSLGRYGEIDKETFGDFSSSTEIMNKKATYVKSTKVKNGSETYTCEEYKASDGTIIKYYFNSKNEWKRWETIDGDTVGVFVINSFGKGAKSSLFEISKFWIKDDSFASLFK